MKKISTVKVLGHGSIRLNWQGGGWDTVTLTPWMKAGRSLALISDREVFRNVSVDDNGKFIVWKDASCRMSVHACMSYAKLYEKWIQPEVDAADRRSDAHISEIQENCAILESPIKFENINKIDESELSDMLDERLDALLLLHQVEPTTDGWKNLALELALILTLNGQSIGGRRHGIKVEFPSVGYDWSTMHLMRQLIDRKGLSQKAAAKIIAKQNNLNASSLSVRYSEYKKKETEICPEGRLMAQVMNALRTAADRLEDAHRQAEADLLHDEKLQN